MPGAHMLVNQAVYVIQGWGTLVLEGFSWSNTPVSSHQLTIRFSWCVSTVEITNLCWILALGSVTIRSSPSVQAIHVKTWLKMRKNHLYDNVNSC